MRRLNLRVCVQFAEVFNSADPIHFQARVRLLLEIWVSRAVVNAMADLFAAETLQIGSVIVLATALKLIIRIVFFRLVLVQPATIRLFMRLSTAPVHIASPKTAMNPTTPHKVVLLGIILPTTFTLLDSTVEFALTLNHFLNSALHF